MQSDDSGSEDVQFGGCEGPEAKYVKLVSSDDHEFIVKRRYALTSGKYACAISGTNRFFDKFFCDSYFML